MNHAQPSTPSSKGFAEPPPARPHHRPWYRLHWSTWIVVVAVLALLTLANIPRRVNYHGVAFDVRLFYEHGWPFVFLDRYEKSKMPEGDEDGSLEFLKNARDKETLPWATIHHNVRWFDNAVEHSEPLWLDPNNWSFSGEWVVCKTGLALDSVLALLLTCSFAVVYEHWSRKRWQYSLRSLLCAFVVIAGVLAWWRTSVNQAEKEYQAAKGLHSKGFDITLCCDAPVLLEILVGTNYLRSFQRVNSVTTQRFRSRLGENGFDPSLVTDADLEHVHDLHHLTYLSLVSIQVTDRTIERLQGLTKLAVLSLDNTRVTDAGLKFIRDLLRLHS